MIEFTPMTQAERRNLGRYDTPRPLAQALADWAIQNASDQVLEPSCGGGVIVKSVMARLEELGASKPARQIWACDIDPRALAETRRSTGPDEPNLVLGNFLSSRASDYGETKFTVILGNPPYVRLHTMDAATREAARSVLPSPRLLDAKASLWAYFPIHAFKLLAAGGRMGWILPETILHSEYGKQVLRWATQNFERCTAVSLRERCFLTDGAKERVVVLLLSGAGGRSAREIEMIEFTSASECIAEMPSLAKPQSPVLPQLNGHAVPHLISNLAAQAALSLESAPDLQKFSELADVKIGVVTGDNDFFLFTEEQRIAQKLGMRHFQSVVGKFADLGDGVRFKGRKAPRAANPSLMREWLLCPSPLSVDSQLKKYLSTYPNAEILKNKTMGKRVNWQVPQLGVPPDAFLQCMGKQGPRIVLNESGYYCTNTIHRVFFLPQISNDQRRAICLSLHSSYSQLSAEFEGRQYGSGVLKLEPSESKRVLVAFNVSLVQALSRKWLKLSKEAAAKGWESVVPEIDSIIALNKSALTAFASSPKA